MMLLLFPTITLIWLLIGGWQVVVLAQPPAPTLPLEPTTCIACYGGGNPASTAFCNDLVEQASQVDGASVECGIIQVSAAEECGPECLFPPSPEGNCTVCADGIPVGNPNKKVPVIYGLVDTTCSYYDEYALRGLADWLCKDWKQRAGFWCGCPGVENECPLCPEADLDKAFPCFPPCLPFRLSLSSLVTCRTAAYELSLKRAWECNDVFAGFSPLSYCGCDVAPPNVCKICSGNQVLANPGQIIDYHDITCERAQEIASFLWPGYYCNLVRDLASTPCECVDPSSPRTEPPQTPPPSTEPPQTSTEPPQTPPPSTTEPPQSPPPSSTEPPQTPLPSTEPPQTTPPSTTDPPPSTTEPPQMPTPSATEPPQTPVPTPQASVLGRDELDDSSAATWTMSLLAYLLDMGAMVKFVIM